MRLAAVMFATVSAAFAIDQLDREVQATQEHAARVLQKYVKLHTTKPLPASPVFKLRRRGGADVVMKTAFMLQELEKAEQEKEEIAAQEHAARVLQKYERIRTKPPPPPPAALFKLRRHVEKVVDASLILEEEAALEHAARLVQKYERMRAKKAAPKSPLFRMKRADTGLTAIALHEEQMEKEEQAELDHAARVVQKCERMRAKKPLPPVATFKPRRRRTLVDAHAVKIQASWRGKLSRRSDALQREPHTPQIASPPLEPSPSTPGPTFVHMPMATKTTGVMVARAVAQKLIELAVQRMGEEGREAIQIVAARAMAETEHQLAVVAREKAR